MRAIDGDTIIAVLGLPLGVRLDTTLRLARYDAPERGQEGSSLATYALWEMLDDTPLYVETFRERRTFTRYVAEIWVGGEGTELVNVSDAMIAAGHGISVPRGAERW